MAIIVCPECSKKLKVADTSIGKKVKCSCGTVFVAEAAEAPVAPPAPPPSADKVLVACTECATKLKVAATSLGKKMKCPKCAGIFVAALPATAMAEETMIPRFGEFDDMEVQPKAKAKPKPAPDEDLPNFAGDESEDDVEDEIEGDAPTPAAKPVYPSRWLVNTFVFLLVIAYTAFFVVTHPEVKVLDLGLIKARSANPIPSRGGNQIDVKKTNGLPILQKKTIGKRGDGAGDPQKAKSKKDDIKKNEPPDEKQGARREPSRHPIWMAGAVSIWQAPLSDALKKRCL